MSDDPIATRITVSRPDGSTEELAMQEWFVHERAEPSVTEVRFAGADAVDPARGVHRGAGGVPRRSSSARRTR